jgi:hypothetical protein
LRRARTFIRRRLRGVIRGESRRGGKRADHGGGEKTSLEFDRFHELPPVFKGLGFGASRAKVRQRRTLRRTGLGLHAIWRVAHGAQELARAYDDVACIPQVRLAPPQAQSARSRIHPHHSG